jgi:hypothetical protein
VQLRIGARELVGGLTGTVFYDLTVPDFRKEKLMLGGLLLTAASASRHPASADPVVSKLLRPPRRPNASSRRAGLALYAGSTASPRQPLFHQSRSVVVGGRQRGVQAETG